MTWLSICPTMLLTPVMTILRIRGRLRLDYEGPCAGGGVLIPHFILQIP